MLFRSGRTMRKVDGLFIPIFKKGRSNRMEKPKTLEQLRAEKKVPSRFGPVDKRKNSAGTHSGFSRTVNLGIAKDGIYHPLEV